MRYNVEGINNAMNIFPTESENNKNFNDFSDTINTLTNSLDNTITIFQNTIDNANLIDLDGFTENNAKTFDESVSYIWYTDFDHMDKLLSTSTSNDWKVVKDSSSV